MPPAARQKPGNERPYVAVEGDFRGRRLGRPERHRVAVPGEGEQIACVAPFRQRLLSHGRDGNAVHLAMLREHGIPGAYLEATEVADVNI